MKHLNDKSKKRLADYLDFILSAFILLIGIFVVLFGFSWMDFITNSIGSSYEWINIIGWIITTIGIVTILFALVRIIGNVKKI